MLPTVFRPFSTGGFPRFMRTILWSLPVRILRVLLGKTVFVRSGSLCRFCAARLRFRYVVSLCSTSACMPNFVAAAEKQLRTFQSSRFLFRPRAHRVGSSGLSDYRLRKDFGPQFVAAQHSGTFTPRPVHGSARRPTADAPNRRKKTSHLLSSAHWAGAKKSVPPPAARGKRA